MKNLLPRQSDRRRPAFTLLELLLAVAIISILMVLLLPNVRQAPRHRGRPIYEWEEDLQAEDPTVQLKATDMLLEALREGKG